jgi:hypothetical protein
MTYIQLKHSDVMAQVDQVKAALDALKLDAFNASDFGRNENGFSTSFTEGEAFVEMLLSQYIQVLEKNILDTRANVDLLKQQDEAMTRTVSMGGTQPL